MTEKEVQYYIGQNEYVRARECMDALIQEKNVYDDGMAILDASIYEAVGDRENLFRAIRTGLQYSCKNYELYYMLGYYYLQDNTDQAYLCFQNALLYCTQEADRDLILADMEELQRSGAVTVQDTAIVIVSYNACYMMQKNIECIRDTLLRGTYRIVVVDNDSGDGIREWLREQPDILLIENQKNIGFAPACNQAVSLLRETDGQEDIFLLNNDTRLSPNALFWLRMGLYQEKSVGAVGGLSNYAGNCQQLDIEFTLPGEYLAFGSKQNVPCDMPYEERVRLSGFAMLVRGHVWDQVGGMDEAFAPGYFEDDDICMRIAKSGYRLLVCRNSFIYHAGSQSFSHCPGVDELLVCHHQLFAQKYGFDILNHAYAALEDVTAIPFGPEDEFNVLQIGSGLGADLKYLRSMFPKAHMVGIETDEALRKIAQGTECVFRDLPSALEVFGRPTFHVLIISERGRAGLRGAELDMLGQLCLRDCVMLLGNGKRADIRYDQIKLVVWDMDQTFWKGILSEGGVTPLPENVALVKELTDCGIINSISSKNNEEEVLEQLRRLGIEDYFVFCDINWNNKGEQLQKKLEIMRLRPENVLFIDDDPRNLEEGKYYNPGLMTAGPQEIPGLFGYVRGLRRSDPRHERLGHYRMMEKRNQKEKNFRTKEQFLYYSEIVLEIHQDCMQQLDRIAELVVRTNQLNFTKRRDSRDVLRTMLEDRTIGKGYVKVRDRFGDYGIVGFYCFERGKQKLRHFLFSCRIIGMGIAECVYRQLACPDIDIAPPVSVRLKEAVDTPWIHVDYVQDMLADVGDTEKETGGNKIKVLLKGPCDLSTIESYLSGGDLTTEFNYVNERGFITTGQNHSMHIWQSAVLPPERLTDITEEVPFIVPGDFETDIFGREYHVICYSLLPDCHTGLYRNRKTGDYISFGSKNFDLTDPRNTRGYIEGTIVNHAFPFTEEIIKRFSGDWEFVGVTSGEDLIRNLNYMYTHVLGSPMFVLLLGSEIEYAGINEEFADHAAHHKEINALVRAYAGDKDRIRLIEMTDYIHSQEDYADSINHFSRNVYYQLATALCACINEQVKKLKGDRT